MKYICNVQSDLNEPLVVPQLDKPKRVKNDEANKEDDSNQPLVAPKLTDNDEDN